METIDTRTGTPDLHVPVLVVGAGPAGLVTAIGLARHGVRSLVIERHASTSIFPRATGVSVRSMEIFRGWGIDEAVRRGGWRVIPRQATVRTLSDPNPVEAPLGFPDEAQSLAVSPTTAAVSPQDHLEPVLLDHFRSLGGEVRFSTELVSFEQDGRGVRAVLRDRVTGELASIRSEYLVGADGHRSTVRSALGIAMHGPDDLGQFLSILFRADLSAVLGDRTYGLYMLEGGDGPPSVFVPSGEDDRFVFAIPLPPGMDEAALTAAFPEERCVAMIREAAGRPDLDVEVLGRSAFAFAAQVAERMRVGRAFLVGDSAHRTTPRGGRGMNTAIADGFDLGWKLAWVVRGIADPALLDSYEAERGPIGRRNVEMSIVPGGGGTDDGLAEDLGWVVGSTAIVPEPSVMPGVPASQAFPPDARSGSRAPHAWLSIGEERISTLDLFGRELVLVTAGNGTAWRDAAARLAATGCEAPIRVRAIGRWLGDADGAFARSYGLADGGAVVVRPDGVIAWRSEALPADPVGALSSAVAIALGRGTDADRRRFASDIAAASEAA